jgi:ferric-dicitrate binding protein FerR (iron transport regulator)
MKLLRFPQKPASGTDPMNDLLGSFAQDFPTSEHIEAEVADATPEELAEAEAATEAILARLAMADPHVVEPAPRRVRPPIWVSGLVGLAAAAAVAFYIAPTRVGPVEGEIPADVASSEVVVPLVVPLADGPGLTLQPESIVAKETLTAPDGSESEVAVLTAGGLSFERHNGIVPEIEEVRWARLPLVAHPVGTVFDAHAVGNMAIVQVHEGTVDLRDTHARSIGTVEPGQMFIVRMIGDKLDRIDVTVNAPDAWSYERIQALGPEGPALANAVIQLRSKGEPVLTTANLEKLGATR